MEEGIKEDNSLDAEGLFENADNYSLDSASTSKLMRPITPNISPPISPDNVRYDRSISPITMTKQVYDMNEELKKEIERLNKQRAFDKWKRDREAIEIEQNYIDVIKRREDEFSKIQKRYTEEVDMKNAELERAHQYFAAEINNMNQIIAEQGKQIHGKEDGVPSPVDTRVPFVHSASAGNIMSSNAYVYSETKPGTSMDKGLNGVIPPADDDSSVNDASGNNLKKTYKKFTYKQIQEKIAENYFDDKTSYSSALDIIGTYLRGQKIIYMESKSYCENKLNGLMMPSIFLSTAATVLSAIVKEFYWGAYLIAAVNGIIAFLLAIVNYLKLDAASEAHKITAHQYDKLQTKIEFLSGQTLLFDTKKETIEKELEDVKKKIEEIKETNQFIVPKKIRTLYPIMFNTNVFLIIKKIDDITKKKINKIKDLKNEKNYLIEVLNSKETKGKDKKTLTKIELRIGECEKEKKRHEENIVVLKSAFSIIDEMFMKEMENAEKYKTMTIRRWLFCGFGVKEKITDPRQLNIFIEGIMRPFNKIEEEISLSKKGDDNDINQLVNDLTHTKKILSNKRLDELKRRQKTIKDLKKANILLKENIDITEEIYNKMEVYDKLERGQYDKINYQENENTLKLNKPKKIVKLLGIGGYEEEQINLKIQLDEEKYSMSGSENSDPYMDYDVCKRENENDN